MKEDKSPFVGYEYKTITTSSEKASQYLDCYENFGWELDTTVPSAAVYGQIVLKMKRDRKIINKMELTRLQRHFEACADEIEKLERTKLTVPTMWAIVAGVIGTVLMACSVFASVHTPPIIWLGILLAIPAFMGWIFPYFIFRKLQRQQAEKVQPDIESKIDEIYEICEKGHSLL